MKNLWIWIAGALGLMLVMDSTSSPAKQKKRPRQKKSDINFGGKFTMDAPKHTHAKRRRG